MALVSRCLACKVCSTRAKSVAAPTKSVAFQMAFKTDKPVSWGNEEMPKLSLQTLRRGLQTLREGLQTLRGTSIKDATLCYHAFS